MKKNERFYAQGIKRSGESTAPKHGGVVTKITKDSYFVLWDGSAEPIEIKLDKFEKLGKHKDEKNKGVEVELHKIRKDS